MRLASLHGYRRTRTPHQNAADNPRPAYPTPSSGRITATLSSIGRFFGVADNIDVVLLRRFGPASSQNSQVVACGDTALSASARPAGTYYVVVDGSLGLGRELQPQRWVRQRRLTGVRNERAAGGTGFLPPPASLAQLSSQPKQPVAADGKTNLPSLTPTTATVASAHFRCLNTARNCGKNVSASSQNLCVCTTGRSFCVIPVGVGPCQPLRGECL